MTGWNLCGKITSVKTVTETVTLDGVYERGMHLLEVSYTTPWRTPLPSCKGERERVFLVVSLR